MSKRTGRRYGVALGASLALICVVAVSAQNPSPAASAEVQSAAAAGDTPQAASAATQPQPATGLADLSAMTFSCPQAGLNAAAREAAKAPSFGTYQFAYFNIVSDAHHAMYEVHFRSNVQSEPLLRYCVALYCQQGWDPRTSKTEVTLMSEAPKRGRQAMHAVSCEMPSGTERRRGNRR